MGTWVENFPDYDDFYYSDNFLSQVHHESHTGRDKKTKPRWVQLSCAQKFWAREKCYVEKLPSVLISCEA